MQTTKPKGIAREPQRYELTGVPTSTWYDLQNAGRAPKPIPLGPRSRGWLIEELLAWVEARRAERDKAAKPFQKKERMENESSPTPQG